MKGTTTFLLLIHILLLLFLHPSAAALLDLSSAAAAPSPGPSGAGNDTEFILVSCQSTLYPKICFRTLATYAGSVQHDRGKLAMAAISVSMRAATHAAARLKSHLSSQAANSTETAALQDCCSVLEDTVDQMHDSLAQLRQLGGDAESRRFQLSNVQTWMSAAETNEDTCLEGFGRVGDGALKAEVRDRVGKVMRVTSNALALVNYFANGP